MSYDLAPEVRAQLLDELAEYVLDAPDDLEVVQRMYDFVGDEDADTATEHVTASAIVVSPAGVLLHLHRSIGEWIQPGGHLDAGEHPADAARREVAEETGIDAEHWQDGPRLLRVDVHEVAATGHIHHDFQYLMTAPPAPPTPPDGESPEVAWFPFLVARDRGDVSVRAPIERAMRVVLANGEGSVRGDASS